MSIEFPTDPRQALEVSLTALVLGELPPDQAEFLRRAMAQDPELARTYERLRQTIDLVRETEKTPVQQPATSQELLKLSEDRRQELLQHFKTAAPNEFGEPTSRSFRWLVPVGIAAVFVVLAGGMLLPVLSKAKSRSSASFRHTAVSDQMVQLQPSVAQPAALQAFQQERLPALATIAPPASEVAALPPPKVAIVLPSTDDEKNRAPSLTANGSYGGFGMQETPRVALHALAGDQSAALGDKTSGANLRVESLALNATPPPQGTFPSGGRVAGGSYGESTRPQVPPPGKAFGFGGMEPASKAADDYLLRSGLAARTPNSGESLPPPSTLAGVPQAQSAAPPADATFRFYGLARGATVPEENSTASKSKVQEATPGGQLYFQRPATGLPAAGGKVEVADVERYKAAAEKKDIDSRKTLGNAGQAWSVGADLRGVYTDNDDDGVPILGDRPLIGKAMDGAVVDFVPQAGSKAEKEKMPAAPVVTPAPPAPSTREPQLSLGVAKASRGRQESQAESVRANVVTNAPVAQLDQGVEAALGRKLADSIEAKDKVELSKGEELSESRLSARAARLDGSKAGVAATSNSPAPGPNGIYSLNIVGYVNVPVQSTAEQQVALAKEKMARLEQRVAPKQADEPPAKPAVPAPVPQPEVQTADNAFSTFSLNVSDVSFKTAAASLEKGLMPEPGTIRSEEFINAFDYRDPEPAPGMPVGFSWDRARYPFAQNRDVLRFALKTASQGRSASQPLNIVLLLDNSGSMERADRVRIIREALKVLAAQLQPQDKLSVVTFARTAQLRVDGVPGNQAGEKLSEVSELTPQGGTNLEEAMNLAYQTALKHYLPTGINRVVLLTDGAANLGDVEPENLKKKVEDHRKQGIALDCFGIGWEGYNDDLLETLTRNGDGRYGFINTPEEAATEFAPQLAGALHVAASDVKVQVEFNPKRITAWRQIGYAKHQLTKEQFRDNTVDAAEIGAAESGNALYIVEVNPSGEGPLGTVRIRYKVPGTSDYHEHEWTVPFNGNAAALEQSSPALKLATTASAFSEWLATSPYATEVTTETLLRYVSGVPEVYGADPRPKKLEWMVRQAGSLGK